MSEYKNFISNINSQLIKLKNEPSMTQAKTAVNSIICLLDKDTKIEGIKNFELFYDDNNKITANGSWFLNDEIVLDRKATYLVSKNNSMNLDIKLYGISAISKKTISWIAALTPNFEDEPYFSREKIGIDFVVPKSLDRIIIVLSKNYIIRTIELNGELTATYQEIFSNWYKISDFASKALVHEILWKSFDIKPINEKFYLEIVKNFLVLKQHLLNSNIMDESNASLFANRLIGRIIFCWFLNKKNLLSKERDYFNSPDYEDDNDYYSEKLEVLFFEVLNKPLNERDNLDLTTPYLNGGLFEKKNEDRLAKDKLFFPTNYFDNLFSFLESYNFTTDESTSQFQQVAIDPEMLGRIFENLLAEMTGESGQQARKAKGAFYTPREVVDYMCRESLKDYLRLNLTPSDLLESRLQQLVDASDREFLDQDHNWRDNWKKIKPDVIILLENLRVIDISCGSGAFPIGMLQLLLRIHERLEPHFDKAKSYKTKLSIIEKNIFGVDIEPMAIEIARLRAWLSLIVDEDTNTKNVKPLPNLDFKFVCANSLFELDKNSHFAPGEDVNLKEKLRDIRNKYFMTTDVTKKAKLRQEYDSKTKLDDSIFGDSTYSLQLKSFKPFNYNQPALFFDSDYMFGVSNFDIAIGNPPYGAKFTKEEKAHYKLNYSVARSELAAEKGSLNSYVLFIERCLKLLNKNGNFNLIVPISVCSSDSSTSLHRFLEDKCDPIAISSFAVRPQPVFENAMVNTSIIRATRTNTKCRSVLVTKMYRKSENTSMSELLGNIKFIEGKHFYMRGRYPKVSEQIEIDILSKIFSLDQKISSFISDQGTDLFYRSAGGRYFKIITPYTTNSSAEATLRLTKKYAMSLGGLLSSNLFFWYYQVFSDNLNIKKYEIENFPVPRSENLDKINNALTQLYKEYLADAEKNALTRSTSKYKHISEFKEYKLGHSKKFIDKIDELIYSSYGLTEDEKNFIINYELDTRLSDYEIE